MKRLYLKESGVERLTFIVDISWMARSGGRQGIPSNLRTGGKVGKVRKHLLEKRKNAVEERLSGVVEG
jgi:hypothetical protein